MARLQREFLDDGRRSTRRVALLDRLIADGYRRRADEQRRFRKARCGEIRRQTLQMAREIPSLAMTISLQRGYLPTHPDRVYAPFLPPLRGC